MENLTQIVKNKLEEQNGFIKNNNYNVIKVDEYYCELEGILTKTSMNHLNVVHGGYLFGLADTAGGIAAMTSGKNVMTIDSSINYLRKTNGKKVLAKASAIKVGKTFSVFEVLLFNEEDEMVARATMTYYFLDY